MITLTRRQIETLSKFFEMQRERVLLDPDTYLIEGPGDGLVTVEQRLMDPYWFFNSVTTLPLNTAVCVQWLDRWLVVETDGNAGYLRETYPFEIFADEAEGNLDERYDAFLGRMKQRYRDSKSPE